MDFTAYKTTFNEERTKLRLPADCTAEEPDFVSSTPNAWHVIWYLTFSDGHYILCREFWSHKIGKPSRRHMFSFHYGPLMRRNAAGAISYRVGDPVVLRIDQKNAEPVHMHYQNPLPHIGQDKVDGLTLDSIGMFAFLQAVIRAREEKRDLHDVIGFRIKP